MKILMVSLDKKILDKESIVAKRMIEYGKKDELFIIIPSKEKKSLDLSQTAHAQSTGGLKPIQFCRLLHLGKKIIHNSKFIILKVGLATTPMFYFLVKKLKAGGGIMITASHNPPNYNGLKIVDENALPMSGLAIKKLFNL